jgi:hypothetical protein
LADDLADVTSGFGHALRGFGAPAAAEAGEEEGEEAAC